MAGIIKVARIRDAAEASLETFIRLVHPGRVLGAVHSEVIDWWERPDRKSHSLLLLPRDHMKSALITYRAAQKITTDPAVRILLLSATANLATKQLKFIKDILTSEVYRFYWPEMVNLDEGKREKWTETEISVDHPKRKEENVRDPTVFVGGLTTVVTGLHCDVNILDDIVIKENAYHEDGRQKVSEQYSLLSSVESTDSEQWVAGTHYHPRDLYTDMKTKKIEILDENGEIESEEPLYEVFERQVEDRGDGTGVFLWPRQQREDGKWFGFNKEILAKKKAGYSDITQFRAQYYNDPNDVSTAAISPDLFQYYERGHLSVRDGQWYFRQTRLNVFAAIDFAFSLQRQADYTSIVVVGMDENRNIYILDIDRFKTDKISDYFDHLLRLYRKWDFRKLRAEVTVGQAAIVKELKQAYIQRHGLALSIDEHRPTRSEGTKEDRMTATLQPLYQNLQVWHYQDGNIHLLEEELVRRKPAHDDIKDALTAVVDICVPPGRSFGTSTFDARENFTRFGGI